MLLPTISHLILTQIIYQLLLLYFLKLIFFISIRLLFISIQIDFLIRISFLPKRIHLYLIYKLLSVIQILDQPILFSKLDHHDIYILHSSPISYYSKLFSISLPIYFVINSNCLITWCCSKSIPIKIKCYIMNNILMTSFY